MEEAAYILRFECTSVANRVLDAEGMTEVLRNAKMYFSFDWRAEFLQWLVDHNIDHWLHFQTFRAERPVTRAGIIYLICFRHVADAMLFKMTFQDIIDRLSCVGGPRFPNEMCEVP